MSEIGDALRRELGADRVLDDAAALEAHRVDYWILAHLRARGAYCDICTAAHIGDRDRVRELLHEDPSLANRVSDYVTYYVGSGSPLRNGAANGHASVVDIELQSLYYGDFKAVRDTSLAIKRNTVTAFIGPSGCGKSTVLRSINRMNDLIRGFRFQGQIRFRGRDRKIRAARRGPRSSGRHR